MPVPKLTSRRGCLYRLIAICVMVGLAMFAYRLANRKALPTEVVTVLENADQLEFLSMDPNRYEHTKTGTELYGFRPLGSITITDVDKRQALLRALKHAVDDHRHNFLAACSLRPRHAIRGTAGDTTMELLICFECEKGVIYKNGEPFDSLLLTDIEEDYFNEVLTKAGINLTPDPREWEAETSARLEVASRKRPSETQ